MKYLSYENFDLRIRKEAAGEYLVEVTASPAGEIQKAITVQISPDDPALTGPLAEMQQLRADRHILREFGTLLSSCLFPPPIWSLYQASLASLPENKGLRVRLRIDPPELTALPWEYSYDQQSDSFFALDPRSMLVRYNALPFSPVPLSSPIPVHVLVVISTPTDLASLNIASEKDKIRAALDKLIQRGDVVLEFLEGGATVEALQDRLRADCRVLHYIGHGMFDLQAGTGMLALEDQAGRTHLMDAEVLAMLLRHSGVRMVVLNACETAAHNRQDAFMGLAPALVRAEVPAVVAMQFEIPDESAIHFARTFYAALADGWPVDAAVTEGRKAVRARTTADDMDWGIPALFMRAPDGVIWQVQSEEDRQKAQSGQAKSESDIAEKGGTIYKEGGVTIGEGAHVKIGGHLAGRDLQVVGGDVYTAGRDLLQSQAADRQDLLAELQKIRDELSRAIKEGTVDDEEGILAVAQVDAAINHARKPSPEPDTIVRRLSRAQEMIEKATAGAGAAAGLVMALAKAIEAVRQFFN